MENKPTSIEQLTLPCMNVHITLPAESDRDTQEAFRARLQALVAEAGGTLAVAEQVEATPRANQERYTIIEDYIRAVNERTLALEALLPESERELLSLMLRGLPSGEIAKKLRVSTRRINYLAGKMKAAVKSGCRDEETSRLAVITHILGTDDASAIVSALDFKNKELPNGPDILKDASGRLPSEVLSTLIIANATLPADNKTNLSAAAQDFAETLKQLTTEKPDVHIVSMPHVTQRTNEASDHYAVRILLSHMSETTMRKYDFTEREKQVARLILGGFTNADIAKELYLSPNTVKGYVNSLFQKIGADVSRSALASCLYFDGLGRHARLQ